MRTASSAHRGVAVRAMLGGIAAVGLVAGCSTSVDGEPAAQGKSESTTSENVAFNPCTDVPSEALQAAKVDESSKATVTDAPTGPVPWRICRWTSTEGPYAVSIGSSTHTQEEARANPNLAGYRDVQIGNRSALVYYDKQDADKLMCYVNLPWASGMFEVAVGWFYSKRDSMPQSPPCDLAVQHATSLEPYLPH
ncbi:DUF3558 domain-containing protein [Nocardia cyriacigeorgica]|uniref:DUF3558 domain-containing protein n=1 Tax=Nocardia cyriacigeorgica TaxID=135487 RepID=A0A5R8P9E0_9NOCA|nr:DUF3558 domain-containing protein [Nocardia cyriacigeorgica]TLG03491.1 DUF3558 domain-containing protein [Nocardia cyriacigeorgica]